MWLWLAGGRLRGAAQSLRQSSLGETGHLVLFRSLRNSLGEQYPYPATLNSSRGNVKANPS